MTIYQLLEYNSWATSKLLQAVQNLSPDQFVEEVAGSQSSVRQQFVHLLSVTDRYRARMEKVEVPDVQPEDFEMPNDLVPYAYEVRHKLEVFLTQLDDNRLSDVIEHATRKGLFRASVEQTLFHMVNHANYHRGQIANLLKIHSVDFPDTDFIIWVQQAM